MSEKHFKVSVVMSVFDKPKDVRQTINSVLNQKGVDFELLVVNDGANKSVVKVLHEYSDNRIQILNQPNRGLTKSLIKGCQQAKYDFIARIDAGDTMLSGRLIEQAQTLMADSELGMVTSWVNIRTEEGYDLYTINLSQTELESGLKSESSSNFVSPFHASMMFRKSLYHEVGAYRDAFYFTQDCDLWSRMIERSNIAVIEKVLTHGLFSPKGISGQYQPQQSALRELVIKAAQLRKQDKSDMPVLQIAEKIHPSGYIKKSSEFDTVYFLAKILTENRSEHASEYWQRALKLKPWSFRARLFSAQNFFLKINKKNNA